MIPRTHALFQPKKAESWKKRLADAISHPMELLRLLDLQDSPLAEKMDAQANFRLRVPREFVDKMKKGDPNDPLLLQVLPLAKELNIDPAYLNDPVGDLGSEIVPGVLHKYHGRALLVTTGACGIHCRYCFRRHFPYAESNPSIGQWQQALNYLRETPSINEVLLSGGDPLSLSDNKLANLVKELEQIPHLKRLRLHTRMPIVLPQRIDEQLLDWICTSSLKVIMVLHVNHANELDDDLRARLELLRQQKVTLLNQSVLLRNINDDVDVLADLSNKLFENNILPYYLHLLDPVQGAAHFDLPRDQAIALMEQLRQRLPGYLVPKLVYEKAGEKSKLNVF